jgi:DNA-directed RNA polymerase subunit RPC12/RpoP
VEKDFDCVRCPRAGYCEKTEGVCDKCRATVGTLYYYSFSGYDDGCYCEACYEEIEKRGRRELWEEALGLIGVKAIRCVRCGRGITHKDPASTRFSSDLDRLGVRCPECGLEFCLLHDEPGRGERGESGRGEPSEQEKIDRFHLQRYGEY